MKSESIAVNWFFNIGWNITFLEYIEINIRRSSVMAIMDEMCIHDIKKINRKKERKKYPSKWKASHFFPLSIVSSSSSKLGREQQQQQELQQPSKKDMNERVAESERKWKEIKVSLFLSLKVYMEMKTWLHGRAQRAVWRGLNCSFMNWTESGAAQYIKCATCGDDVRARLCFRPTWTIDFINSAAKIIAKMCETFWLDNFNQQ